MAKKVSLLSNLNLSEIDKMNNDETQKSEKIDRDLVLQHFDFNFDLEKESLDFLKNQTLKLQGTMSKAYTEIGKILFETQQELSNNKTGIFEAWYREIGFSKQQVYRWINRYEFILSQNVTIKNMVESLPITLSYELTNSSCDEILKEKILDGKIKNLKEFYEEKRKIEEEKSVLEVLDFEDIFEKDIKNFKKNYANFNKILKENFENISKDKKEILTKDIEIINKKIEKILKEF